MISFLFLLHIKDGTIALGGKIRIELFPLSNKDSGKTPDKLSCVKLVPNFILDVNDVVGELDDDGVGDISIDQCAQIFVEFINRIHDKENDHSESCS